MGNLLQTIGAVFGLFRGLIPADLSIIAGNAAVFLGVALEVYCIVHVGRVPLTRVTKRWIQIVSVITVAFTLFYLSGASLGARVFFSAITLTAYSLTAAAGLYFHSDTTKLRKILAVFFVILAVSQAVRAVEGLLRGENYTYSPPHPCRCFRL